ncbi:BZ3500_MvSof-1268-A1-R1_Chr7-1g09075 [Microbotryum saponariae]|uniref:BZ3500_MvSof-1268-A1-R1_Chr7-1g09075 protein n=1 Tax=Microbotryum saponariae TaxID=289078 RepID=A0A2X0LD61_9BASI|nr:BZ3500_MvSof-1268-A1-R1_Chr7-1g09075 [Microbotryum saponariae]
MRSSIIVLFTAMVGLVVAAGGDSHHPPGQSHTNGKKKDPQALKQCKLQGGVGHGQLEQSSRRLSEHARKHADQLRAFTRSKLACRQCPFYCDPPPRGDVSRTVTQYRNNHETALHAPVIRIGPHSHERETVQLPELSK